MIAEREGNEPQASGAGAVNRSLTAAINGSLRLTLYCRASRGPREGLMARSAGSKRRSAGQLAASLALSLALIGCQTTQPGDTTGALDVASAPHGGGASRHSTAALGDRYRANPNDPAAAIRYAQRLRETGERWEAVAVLERAALYNSKHPALLAAYGRALAEVGDYQHAFEVLNLAHTPDRPNWRILSVQGAVLDEMGRHEEAQRYYGTALRMAPNEPSVLSNLGISYALAKDLVRAETTLRKAASQSRREASIGENLALVMRLQGRPPETEGGMPTGMRADEPAAALRELLARQNGWTEAGQADKPQLRAQGS
jgi:Flp pilus assembly protein TadD